MKSFKTTPVKQNYKTKTSLQTTTKKNQLDHLTFKRRNNFFQNKIQ